MSYNFFPESESEIKVKLKGDETKISEIMRLFSTLSKKYKIKAPINIDPQKIGMVNVTRDIQSETDINSIKSLAKIRNINIKFGNGSSGNRGSNNQGNAFESKFAQSIRDYIADEDSVSDKSTLDAIKEIDKLYKFSANKKVKVLEVGELNNKRPLVFSPKILISSKTPIQNNDVGKVVTDLTITGDDKDLVYLSLKASSTVTFFNAGVRTILTPAEIKSGNITNKDGLALLKLFNIHPGVFCDVFNKKLKAGFSEDVFSKLNKTNIVDFLKSGIGHGYCVVHKLSGKIKVQKIDQSYLSAAATPTSCIVYYGGKGGNGQRIDVMLETGKYILKINIRDKQGSGGYPTHIMSDFTYN